MREMKIAKKLSKLVGETPMFWLKVLEYHEIFQTYDNDSCRKGRGAEIHRVRMGGTTADVVLVSAPKGLYKPEYFGFSRWPRDAYSAEGRK